ncbi:hypothetical protein WSM22_14970 [Cytophagales bacterium WSM2-2]|nr:hypothetical protein WSM22_14970 [Cytophagales bacterium WSM2-2]
MLEVLIIGLLLISLLGVVYALVQSRKKTQLLRLQSQIIQKNILELEDRNRQLQDLAQEKLQLISLVSHDLKGPFNRIFALVQLLNLENKNLNEEQKEYIGKILHVAVDGLGMVRNLLDSRKFEEKGIEFQEGTLDFTSLVSSLTKHYRAVAEKKKIEITLEIDKSTLIKSDKMYLGRVIENLLSNAVKFSPENTRIDCSIRTIESGVEFSVIDQGPGISKEDQEKLFQRFQPLTPKPTGGESSSGLGLYITKSIVDKMGGEISCESEVGNGTRFNVRLPKRMMIS